MKRIFITGGHHNSALAFLDWLNNHKDKNSLEFEIYWFGKKYINGENTLSPEYIEVSKRNQTKYINIIAGKLYRLRSPRYIHLFFYNLFLIPFGFISSFYFILKYNPDLIISFGGYIGLPFVLSGWILNKKIILHEQTVTVGLANKMSSFFADKICLSWPLKFYDETTLKRYSNKVIFTGLPLRELSYSQLNFNFENPKNKLLYIMGGKLGSESINSIVLSNLDFLVDQYNVIWSIGSKGGTYSKDKLILEINKKRLERKVYIKEYFQEDEMSYIYKNCSLAISRSGAHSVYEYLAFGIPAILIPIPWSSKNEQLKNAKILEESGLGFIIEEDRLSDEIFKSVVVSISNKIKNKDNFQNIDKSVYLNGSEKLGNEVIQVLS